MTSVDTRHPDPPAPAGHPSGGVRPKSRLKVSRLNTLHTFDGEGGIPTPANGDGTNSMANAQKSPTKIIIATIVILATPAPGQFRAGAADVEAIEY